METITKKIIGRLPVNETYKVNSVEYAPKGSFDCCECENCGKIISNIAIVENSKGEKFSVGLDCAETMGCYEKTGFFALLQDKKTLARMARFMKWYKTLKMGEIIDTQHNSIFFYETPVVKWEASWKYRMPLDYFKKTYPSLSI